LTLCRGIVR